MFQVFMLREVMPLTPLHLGSGLFFGIIFLKLLDLPAFLFGSVFPDIEPAIVVIFNHNYPYLSYPHHGIIHSFLAGILAAILLALLLRPLQKTFIKYGKRFFGEMYPGNEKPFFTIFLAAFSGYSLHILFDSFTHYDVLPFWPLKLNPFLRLISVSQSQLLVYILSALGLIFFLVHFKNLPR